jgi:hypothetical protein
MKKVLNITLVLMTLAFTSTVFAEIMEGIRIECKDSDGKKLCKPIKVGDPPFLEISQQSSLCLECLLPHH